MEAGIAGHRHPRIRHMQDGAPEQQGRQQERDAHPDPY
jgi:hypothetical protein